MGCSGKGSTCKSRTTHSSFQHMTNPSIRCANKAATDAAVWMRVAGDEASQDSSAGFRSPAAADKQPAAPKVASARGHLRAASSSAALAAGRRTIGDDPEILVLYSGESDSPSDSKSSAKPSREAEVVESTTSHKRGSIDPELHRELFGSSDESMESSPESSQSHSHSFDASKKQDDLHRPGDVDDTSRSHCSRSNLSDRGDRSVHGHTTQEEQDLDALRYAPQNSPWIPLLSKFREWHCYTTESYRIPLFNLSRLHGLDVSAINYRTEHGFYIDVFFRHRWYHGNHY